MAPMRGEGWALYILHIHRDLLKTGAKSAHTVPAHWFASPRKSRRKRKKMLEMFEPTTCLSTLILEFV
jgi:hypothetical protein